MTVKWITPILLAVVIGAGAFGITRRVACRPNSTGIDRLGDAAFLAHALNLRENQFEEIKDLHADLSAKLIECCARHCDARRKLGESLTDRTADTGEPEKYLRAMSTAYAESETLVMAHILKVRDLLDTEQRHRFDQLIAGRLTQPCGICPADDYLNHDY